MPLFAVYLSIPVLAIIKENRKVFVYMVTLGLLTYSVLPFGFALLGVQYNSAISFPMTGGYLIFVMLGYLLSTVEIKAFHRYVIYGMGIAGIVIRYGMTYVLSIRNHELNKTSWGYLNLPSVLLAVAVFTFFRHVNWEKICKGAKSAELIRKISAASFGIYLIHMPLVRAILSITDWDSLSWKWRYFGPLIVYTCALGIVTVIKKIPILKKIVP